MKKLFFVIAFLAMFVSCDEPVETITTQTSSLTLGFHFNSENVGESMTKAFSNSEVFSKFYATMKSGALVASDYTLSFTEVNTGDTYNLSGKWNERQKVAIKMGTYKVEGTATAEGEYIQEKCSITINEPQITIDRDDATISLRATYDCALVIFNDESVASVVNHTGANKQTLFEFSNYIYAFVNRSIWDGVSESYLLGTRHNGSQFTIPTNSQHFEKGKYYVYDTTKTTSFESGVLLPEMEEGMIGLGAPPQTEIWYTSTDGKVVVPQNATAFSANIVSNTYVDGKGVIKFDDVVNLVSGDAFWRCETLKSISFPSSVTTIPWGTCIQCTSLKDVEIYGEITAIGAGAFGLSGITSFIIPESVTSIGGGNTALSNSIFQGCENLIEIRGKYASEDGRCLIVDGVLNSFAPAGLTEYTIPDGVTAIERCAFNTWNSHNSGLISITIPNSVTAIGDDAFQNCSSLASITIPDSVTSIGGGAFQGCSSLASVTVGQGVTKITASVFHNCSSLEEFRGKYASDDGRCLIIDGELSCFAPAGLTEYTIPYGVTSIGNCAFQYCSNLTSITIPNSVTSIGNSAFEGCSSLTSITIPDSVTSIGERAFVSSSLTSITIPDSVTSIGESAFASSSLTSITIPDSITSIEWWVFQDCSSLTNVNIGNGVTSIGMSAFSRCSSLTNISIPDSVTSIELMAFQDCSNLANINIGNNVNSIGNFAFSRCSSLTSVTIPDSVTSIGTGAFEGCTSLSDLTLSANITGIKDFGLSTCTNLVDIYCRATTPPTLSSHSVLLSTGVDRKIYVPYESYELYKTAPVWRFIINNCLYGYNYETGEVVKDPEDSTTNYPTTTITIDGDCSDWEMLNQNYVSTATCAEGAKHTALKNLKVCADELYLYVYFEYDEEQIDVNLAGVELLINSDNSEQTGGYNNTSWYGGYFDYICDGLTHLEGIQVAFAPSVFTWIGEVGVDGWNWGDEVIPSETNVSYGVGTTNSYELAIKHTSFYTLSDTFTIGCLLHSQWITVGVLPNASCTDNNTKGWTEPLSVSIMK